MVSCYCHKPVTGDKNGGTRVFQFGSLPRYYPAEEKAVHSLQKPFCQHRRALVVSFPGPFCSSPPITTQPKRSFPEAAEEAWDWTSGPPFGFFLLNPKEICHCYLHQNWPENSQTSYSCYFKNKPHKSSLQEGEIFDTEKEEYQVRKQSNIHQKALDSQLMPETKAVA